MGGYAFYWGRGMSGFEFFDAAYMVGLFGFVTLIGVGKCAIWARNWWRDRNYRRRVREHELDLRVERAMARDTREKEARLRQFEKLTGKPERF